MIPSNHYSRPELPWKIDSSYQQSSYRSILHVSNKHTEPGTMHRCVVVEYLGPNQQYFCNGKHVVPPGRLFGHDWIQKLWMSCKTRSDRYRCEKRRSCYLYNGSVSGGIAKRYLHRQVVLIPPGMSIVRFVVIIMFILTLVRGQL
jgi:hypothetical protein